MARDKQDKAEEKPVMQKCNYCADSSRHGKCRWISESIRAEHCEEAIRNMVRCHGGLQGGVEL